VIAAVKQLAGKIQVGIGASHHGHVLHQVDVPAPLENKSVRELAQLIKVDAKGFPHF
jgi:hypothetical protein